MSASYNITKSPDGGLWMDLRPANIKDQVLFAKENGVTNFSCTFHPADQIDSFPDFDGIDVTGLFIGSLAGIRSNQSLNGLSHLRLLKMNFEGPVSGLDFSKLTRIEELEIMHNNKVAGLRSLINLKSLRLLQYKPASKDLQDFKGFEKIRKINLIQPVVGSLEGIQYLHQLTELSVSKPKGLTAFFTKDYGTNLTGLKTLELSYCKELDLALIPRIESLVELRIINCKTTESLDLINDRFPGLRSFTFTGSESMNGNLDSLVDHPALERVTIDAEKHYNLKEKEINAMLSGKRNKN